MTSEPRLTGNSSGLHLNIIGYTGSWPYTRTTCELQDISAWGYILQTWVVWNTKSLQQRYCVNKPWNRSAGGLNQLCLILVLVQNSVSVCVCVCVCVCLLSWFYLRSPSHLDGTDIKIHYKNLREEN